MFVRTDVGDPASTDAMAETAVGRFGGIDHLVNNAAIFGDMELAGLTTVDYEYLDRFMKVNLMGALHCTRSVMGRCGPAAAARSSSSRSGLSAASVMGEM